MQSIATWNIGLSLSKENMPRKAIDEMNSPHLLGFGATPQGLSSMQWHVTLL